MHAAGNEQTNKINSAPARHPPGPLGGPESSSAGRLVVASLSGSMFISWSVWLTLYMWKARFTNAPAQDELPDPHRTLHDGSIIRAASVAGKSHGCKGLTRTDIETATQWRRRSNIGRCRVRQRAPRPAYRFALLAAVPGGRHRGRDGRISILLGRLLP